MSGGLNEDLTAARRSLDRARQELRANIDQLAEGDWGRARRGGWSVGRVVQHLIHAEWTYVRLVMRLRGLPASRTPEPMAVPVGRSDAVHQLSASRQALLAALDGIDEPALYQLVAVGREEYSVLSVLENVAQHDREHARQLRAIVAAT